MNKTVIQITSISLVLLFLIIFVYPTLYRYDKLEQKYPVKINRITGETKVLRDEGWQTVTDQASIDEVKKLQQEILDIIEKDHEKVKDEVIADVTEKAVEGSKQEVDTLKSEIEKAINEVNEYKKFKKNPDNYFTVGSSKSDVKEIMGTPSSVSKAGPYETWMYDFSSIEFENGKVTGWHDSSGILNTK